MQLYRPCQRVPRVGWSTNGVAMIAKYISCMAFESIIYGLNILALNLWRLQVIVTHDGAGVCKTYAFYRSLAGRADD